jgi:hypothetical protein
VQISGAIVSIESETGRAVAIERLLQKFAPTTIAPAK